MKEEYDIQLTVPLGKRKGTMIFEQNNGIVRGKMILLGSTSEFNGTMNCQEFHINGILKTSIRTIEYQGYGKIKDHHIEIDLIDEDNTYKILGRKIKK